MRSALAREMAASTRRRFVDVALNDEYADLADVTKFYDTDVDFRTRLEKLFTAWNEAPPASEAKFEEFPSVPFKQRAVCRTSLLIPSSSRR